MVEKEMYRLEVENLLATNWRTRRIGRGIMVVEEVEVKETMRRRRKMDGGNGRMKVTGGLVLALIAGGKSI